MGHARIVAALLCIHAGLLWVGLRGNFVVVDEAAHVPSGLSHWETGDFRLYRVNPPLGRLLATVPLVLAQPYVNFRGLSSNPVVRDEFDQASLFAELNAPNYFDLVCLARLAGVAWSLLGGCLIYTWGRELYGPSGGVVGATLWCFDPMVLAFAPLVMPDIPGAVSGLAATYAFWRFLQHGGWSRAVLAGCLLGVAQLTKFTNLALYGFWVVLWAAGRLGGGGARPAEGRPGKYMAIMLLSLFIINLGYGFQGTGVPLGRFEFISRLLGGGAITHDPGGMSPRTGNRFENTLMGSIPVPLPSDYLRGIDVQRKDFEAGMPSYLGGQWKDGGWWYYYVYALAVKEPLGTIALTLWAALLVLRRRPASSSLGNEAALLVPALGFLIFVSSQTGFNHHMRYVLPMFPFVAISTGKLAWYFEHGPRALGLLVRALLAWSILGSVSVMPHWMSYFNEAVGGPTGGHAHLVDSNIDWGQDLLRLKDWLERHPEARPIHLAYFHLLDPTLFGIEFEPPPPGPDPADPPAPEDAARYGPRPGYHAVSVHLLQGAQFGMPDGRGGWQNINRHDYLAYFKLFRPIDRAGYSLLIYHITPEQADAARRRLGLPPLAVEAAAGPADRPGGGDP